MSERTFRPYEPDQLLLLPPSLKEWLSAGHLVYFVSDVVDSLDLKEILSRYGGATRGNVPYDPRMLVKVLIYGYCIGVASSRKIARRLEEDVAFRVLSANSQPDFRTISDFRKGHLPALKGLFVQVLLLCRRAGLLSLGQVSVDGTKMKANASKHKAMSYDRMQKEEARLSAEVEALLKQAEQTDEREDREFGERRGDELPEELAFRESRLAKIQEAKRALEQEAQEAAEAKRREIEERQAQGPRRGPKPSVPEGTPDPKAQRNFTDPDSRIMPSGSEKGSFLQGYNAQAAVDGVAQVIVAADVIQQTNDKRQAVPMLKQVSVNTGKIPQRASLDAGYFSEAAVSEIEKLGCEPLIPPDRQQHGRALPAATRGRIPKSLSVADRMRRKLSTRRGRAFYAKRKEVVEPVFGQIKQARGFRQFLLRGLSKVQAEWSLICTTHNLLKLWKAIEADTPRSEKRMGLARS